MKNILILALMLFGMSSCLKDFQDADTQAGGHAVTLTVNVPGAGTEVSVQSVQVVLRNIITGVSFETMANISDVNKIQAKFDVEYGYYEAKAICNVTNLQSQKKLTYNGVIGRMSVLSTSSTGADGSIAQTIEAKKAYYMGDLLILECYFQGCTDLMGKNYIMKDAYFTIYNNSSTSQFLDNICFGFVNPYNIPTTIRKQPNFKFWEGAGTELRDSVPVTGSAFRFPGNGTDCPIAPGERKVVCLNAIDHINDAGVPNSINLAKTGYFVMYDPVNFTSASVPSSNVTVMPRYAYWQQGNNVVFSIMSPAIVLYKIEGMTPEKYAAPEQYNAEKGYSGNVQDSWLGTISPTNKNIMIPIEWVIDGVEFSNKTTGIFKRLRSEIDASYFNVTAPTGSGVSYQRKLIGEVGGVKKYQDTNNSAEDFEQLAQPVLKSENAL